MLNLEAQLDDEEKHGNDERTDVPQGTPIDPPVDCDTPNTGDGRRGPCLGLKKLLETFEADWPRSYSLLFGVILPIFLLIGIAFLGGYLLALCESGNEMDANDASIADFVNLVVHFSAFAGTEEGIGNYEMIPELCGLTLDLEETNQTRILDKLLSCGVLFLIERDEFGGLSFDWIRCGEQVEWKYQSEHVIDEWMTSYLLHFVDEYISVTNTTFSVANITFETAHKEAIESATGRNDCSVHLAGGALFWFTLMTTIGYGNTAPVTDGGRALVYTLGFASILCFTSLISRAGRICLAIFDDFAHRVGAKRLLRGVWAALFWLSLLALWLLVLAAVSMRETSRKGRPGSLRDMFWFAYISITTVGFGDFYIPHDTFSVGEMFYTPILALLGFVLLANFLLKFSEALSLFFGPGGRSLEDVLEERRKKRK